ncbi:MAG: hypothetical protein AAGA99_00505 [Actinomycetota bacterium]
MRPALTPPWQFGFCDCNVWPMLPLWPGRCRRCGVHIELFNIVTRRQLAWALFRDLKRRRSWNEEIAHDRV